MKKRFEPDIPFTTEALFSLYQELQPDININTFRWRVFELKQRNVIRSIKRGWYVLKTVNFFEPMTSSSFHKVLQLIAKRFPYLDFSIWETRWLHDLMIHQVDKNIIIIEVEKGSETAVFSYLQGFFETIFIHPTQKEIDSYILGQKESYLVRNLISQAPVQLQEVGAIPKLEKILVDVFTDENLFVYYHGKELVTIFENSYNRYGLNMSTMLRYASRRNVTNNITKFMLKEINIPQEIIRPTGGYYD